MIQIKVYGTPAPQGSKRHVGRGIMIESSKAVGPWREAVRHETQQHDGRFETGPVSVDIKLWLPRPKYHYGTGRNAAKLKDSAPVWHSGTPDADKLARAILDAIVQGGALHDDGQAAIIHVYKYYATDVFPPGCLVTIAALLRPMVPAA